MKKASCKAKFCCEVKADTTSARVCESLACRLLNTWWSFNSQVHHYLDLARIRGQYGIMLMLTSARLDNWYTTLSGMLYAPQMMLIFIGWNGKAPLCQLWRKVFPEEYSSISSLQLILVKQNLPKSMRWQNVQYRRAKKSGNPLKI